MFCYVYEPRLLLPSHKLAALPIPTSLLLDCLIIIQTQHADAAGTITHPAALLWVAFASSAAVQSRTGLVSIHTLQKQRRKNKERGLLKMF